MNKRLYTLVALAATAVLFSCGQNSGTGTAPAPATVTGVAAATAPIPGTVTLKDSASPSMVRSTQTDSSGNYSMNVTSLKPPFLLTLESTGTGTPVVLQSFATGPGMANINPLSDAAVLAANGGTGSEMSIGIGGSSGEAMIARGRSVMDGLKTELGQLFQLYGIRVDPVSGNYELESSEYSALFSSISLTVSNATITVTNRQTGTMIFTAPVSDISSGTFYAQNMPTPPGSTTPTPAACMYTYSAWGTCQSNNTQTRTVTGSSPAGCTGTPVLNQTCTYVPPAPTSTPCTYTYSAWGTCQSNNTQTRTVTSSSPAGCTGTPVLTQVCTYVPPAPTLTLSQVQASCTMCHGLTVNTTVLKPGGYTIKGRSAANWLTTVNTMVSYGAMLAPGTTAQDYANFLAALP